MHERYSAQIMEGRKPFQLASTGGIMRTFQKGWMIITALALLVVLSPAAHAQLNSGASNVTLNATLAESLTVSSSAATLTVPIVANGTGTASPNLTITSTWVLAKTRTSVKLFAYFASAASAMSDGAGTNIPSSSVLGSVNSGAYAPFTAAGAFTNNSIQMFSLTGGTMSFNGTRADTLNLEINSTGLNLPAATYTGTLSLQAQAL
jgi:hypothetical protein